MTENEIRKYITLGLSLICLVAMMLVGASSQTSSSISGSGFASQDGVLFQASTISALMEGVYDGMMAFGDLRKKGDFGIGTFDALDGEMVEVDGNIYQIRADGHAYPVNDTATTPLAIVTFFKPEETLLLGGKLDLTQVQEEIDDELPSENVFYALKIEGMFNYVKARAPHAQSKPYPPLAEAVKDQAVFEFNGVNGTLVGFRSPDYINGLNVPGYHMHFITADRSSGGHLLDLMVENATVQLDQITFYDLALPSQGDFYQANLSQDRQEELKEIEGER